MVVFQDLPQNRITDILDKAFHIKNNFFDAGNGCILPQKYRDISEKVKNLKIRDDDVFLCSFPRTGSTWMQEILWLLGNDLNFEKAQSTLQQIRSPLMELSAIFSDNKDHVEWLKQYLDGNSVDYVDEMEGRRFIKSHMPWHLLPDALKSSKNAKIVYTMRNPKDLAISFYHYCVLAHRVNCSLEEFLEVFLENNWPYGNVSKHMIEFYKRRNEPNVLVIKYEDMKRDLPSVIRKCAEHIEIRHTLTDDDIDKICDYVKFDKMEKNSSVNLESLIFKDPMMRENVDMTVYNKVKFIRKGQIGDWRNFLTPEMNGKFDKWIADNFDGTDMSFEYV